MIYFTRKLYDELSECLQQRGIRLKRFTSEQGFVCFELICGSRERRAVISDYDMPETLPELCDIIEGWVNLFPKPPAP